MTLQLQYSCTDADMKEARSLYEIRSGSRSRKWVVPVAVLAALIVLINLRLEHVAIAERVLFSVGAAALFILFQASDRIKRRKASPSITLQVSERDMVFEGSNGRTVMSWSAVGDCLESPNLFVLVDRPKLFLRTIPKRAFPNEGAQDWFRALASQFRSLTPSASAHATFGCANFAVASGIVLTLQMKYRDYLNRSFTSWRTKGMLLLAFITMCITAMVTRPPPNGNPTWKVFLFMIFGVMPMLFAAIGAFSLLLWRLQRDYLQPKRILLTAEGIEFAEQEESGKLAWSAYRYYQENRWAFFVWNPTGSRWFMFPKRAFDSSSDVEGFRKLLKTNLKPSRWFYL